MCLLKPTQYQVLNSGLLNYPVNKVSHIEPWREISQITSNTSLHLFLKGNMYTEAATGHLVQSCPNRSACGSHLQTVNFLVMKLFWIHRNVPLDIGNIKI